MPVTADVMSTGFNCRKLGDFVLVVATLISGAGFILLTGSSHLVVRAYRTRPW